MIVEEQGKSFRTRVRLPPGPLESEQTNRYPSYKIAVFLFSFCLIFDAKILEMFEDEPLDITFSDIREWIIDKYGVAVSNSSISQVKLKCEIAEFKYDRLLSYKVAKLTEKEKYVFQALKHFRAIR